MQIGTMHLWWWRQYLSPSQERYWRSGKVIAHINKTLEAFASAQFLEMSDAEKLNAPSFEPMPSGKAMDGLFELKIMLPETVAGQFIKESKRQNIKMEFLIGKVLERLLRFINEPQHNKTLGL